MDTQIPLVYGEDLSSLPTPQIQRTGESPHILIIGGGVTGLISAWALLDRGYKAIVMAKEWLTWTSEQRLTSQMNGALWVYPPAACGQHTDTISIAKSKKWYIVSYRIWESIAADPTLATLAGVKMLRSTFSFTRKIEDDPEQHGKMLEIEHSEVKGFHHAADLIQFESVNKAQGVVDAYEHLAPAIDTETAMKWLMDLVEGKGVKFVSETIKGDLISQEHSLRARFAADAMSTLLVMQEPRS